MKKYRVIFVHDPKLRKIRNNLRSIICHAVWDRLESLRALQDGLDSKYITDDDRMRQNIVYSESLDLQEALRHSICQCGTCQQIENDMMYIPSLKAWNCVKCDSKNLIWYPSIDEVD